MNLPPQDAANLEIQLDQVIPAVSHELNTALTSVLGNAHVLREHENQLATNVRHDALAALEGEAERLLKAIQNLLLFARLRLGEQPYQQPLAPRRFLEELVANERRRYDGRPLSLRFESVSSPISADESLLRVALHNLIDNARAYSPPGSAIELFIWERQGYLVIEVLDEGEGLDPRELEAIFQPFYRSPNVSDRLPGLGIGLTVARSLAELHGGRINASNRPERGACFTLELPLMRAEEYAA
jgi:two-component system sensor histidine kinase KdpD